MLCLFYVQKKPEGKQAPVLDKNTILKSGEQIMKKQKTLNTTCYMRDYIRK